MAENAKYASDKVVRVSVDIARVMFSLGRAVYTGNAGDIAEATKVNKVTKLSQIKECAYVDMPQEKRGQIAA